MRIKGPLGGPFIFVSKYQGIKYVKTISFISEYFNHIIAFLTPLNFCAHRSAISDFSVALDESGSGAHLVLLEIVEVLLILTPLNQKIKTGLRKTRPCLKNKSCTKGADMRN